VEDRREASGGQEGGKWKIIKRDWDWNTGECDLMRMTGDSETSSDEGEEKVRADSQTMYASDKIDKDGNIVNVDGCVEVALYHTKLLAKQSSQQQRTNQNVDALRASHLHLSQSVRGKSSYEQSKMLIFSGFRMFVPGTPEQIENCCAQRDWVIEEMLISTRDKGKNKWGLSKTQALPNTSGGLNDFSHLSYANKKLSAMSIVSLHKPWMRNEVMLMVNREGKYDTGYEEYIKPEFRLDPANKYSVNEEKLGKEIDYGKSWRSPGMIKVRRKVEDDHQLEGLALRAISKAYMMCGHQFDVDIDWKNHSVILKEAQTAGQCGYLAWCSFSPFEAVCRVFVSRQICASMSQLKQFFNIYMKMFADGKGKGKGISCRDSDAFEQEMNRVFEFSQKVHERNRDKEIGTLADPEEAGKMDMKGKGKGKGKQEKEEDPKGKGKNRVTKDVYPYRFKWQYVEDQLEPHEQNTKWQKAQPWIDTYDREQRMSTRDANTTHQLKLMIDQ